jgi:hypothetical protein
MEVTQIFKAAQNKIKNEKMNRFVNDNYSKFKSKWRKVMTGDEKVRVRDHMILAQGTTENFKLFDKLAFTIGVLNLMMCQFCFVNTPGYFWVFYCVVMWTSLGSRYYHFSSQNWEYFMLDFCYFAVGCSMFSAIFFPEGNWFFRVSYIFANGPLPWAIVVWRNSYVFHDYDRMFSVYIHILPSMLSYVGLANGHCSLLNLLPSKQCIDSMSETCHTFRCRPPANATVASLTLQDFALAVLFYTLWQITYFVKTEVFDKDYLNAHPEKTTSLRWLASDTKNPFARYVLKQLRRVGIFAAGEDYDSKTVKTKIVFMSTQLLYTALTFLLAFPMYRWPGIQFTFILCIIVMSLYNGASYYFEVFSARYNSEVEKHTVRKNVRGKIAKVPSKEAIPVGKDGTDVFIPSKDIVLPVVPVPPTSPVSNAVTAALQNECNASSGKSWSTASESATPVTPFTPTTPASPNLHAAREKLLNDDTDDSDTASEFADSDSPDMEIE